MPGIARAIIRGNLVFGFAAGHRRYVLTDSTGRLSRSWRMDGRPMGKSPVRGIGGAGGGWAIGLDRAASASRIVVATDASDFLAQHARAALEGRRHWAVVSLLECVIGDVGPGHLTISTWTAAEYDASRMPEFVRSGKVTGMRWVIDDIFVKRQPQLAMAICESSEDAVRVFKTHAKFAVIQGERFPVVIRTSMNLNSNPRMEYFEISCDRELAAWFTEIVDEKYKSPAGKRVRLTDIKTMDADPLLGLEI